MSRFAQPVTRTGAAQPPTVPFKWVASMFGLMVLGAGVCAWLALCLMFWQGGWQLLYHPESKIARTPAAKGVSFDEVAFGAFSTGQPSLQGWWIPSSQTQGKNILTAIYFHGASGNMGDAVDMLVTLHNAGLNILTFDYRGYGHSQFVHPSEQRWKEDAEDALSYLISVRHIAPSSILLVGRDLGADLALQIAARHSNLAGLVVISPIPSAANLIFRDPRARLVPARILISDRWELRASTKQLKIPVLWFEWTADPGTLQLPDRPELYAQISAPHNFVWLIPTHDPDGTFSGSVSAWLNDLANKGHDLPPCMAGSGATC
ncbi:MAG TPA: alpha/beta hydrolase [Terracidiphilus sp.]|nr:alpha/beta hydrolase [Terracidiphilus sp.]